MGDFHASVSMVCGRGAGTKCSWRPRILAHVHVDKKSSVDAPVAREVGGWREVAVLMHQCNPDHNYIVQSEDGLLIHLD